MNIGHHHKSGKDYYADTACMNSIRGVMPGFEMKHLGFGEFYLDGGSQGRIEFDRLRGKNFDGQSGRSHKLYDDKGGKLVKKLIKRMEKAGASELVEGILADLRLVESVDILLEATFASGGLRMQLRKWAGGVAKKNGWSWDVSSMGDEVIYINFRRPDKDGRNELIGHISIGVDFAPEGEERRAFRGADPVPTGWYFRVNVSGPDTRGNASRKSKPISWPGTYRLLIQEIEKLLPRHWKK